MTNQEFWSLIMTNQELIETLNKAAESVKYNIPLHFLLTTASERITQLDSKIRVMGWQINPDRMGQ